jgi:hypothetical protein
MRKNWNTAEELQQALDAVASYGNVAAAARGLGISRCTLRDRYYTARAKKLKAETQALAGFAAANPDAVTTPPSNAVPEGQQLRGLSTRVDESGNTDQQWIKTERASGEVFEAPAGYLLKGLSVMTDANGQERVKWQKLDMDAVKRQTAQEAAFNALCEKLEPLAPIKGPATSALDLCTLYTMTDCHVGMLAWDKETGEDWDLGIAERVLTDTLFRMIDAAPDSAVGILNQLGDFLHFDSLVPLTPTNKHVLDADSRYQKVVAVAVRILERVIAHMLTKHAAVQVYMMEGNHDPAGSVWLRIMFAKLFAGNPRVTVELSPNPYVAYQWGKTFLGFYHGHLARKPHVPLLFAAQFPVIWGQTEFRYIHTGHLHHVEEKEHPGIKHIQHPTLAAPDAYAARGGWLSKRQATSMTYHKEYGEFARGIFIPMRDVA